MGCHARQSLDTAHLRLTRTACLLPRPLEPQHRRHAQHNTSYQIFQRQREARRGLCYDEHHVWIVTVVVALPETRPCVLRGDVRAVDKKGEQYAHS
jgi:hypothetical protein